jgi:outer membrane autotransporter protein
VGARSAGTGWLFASTSAVALLAAAASPAHAACDVGFGGYVNLGTAECVTVTSTTFTGNVSNAGTITPGGITITGSSVTGAVISSGTVAGGIGIDSASQIGDASGIAITGPSFAGGISNAGVITAAGIPILIDGASTFSGGIVNSSTGVIQGGGLSGIAVSVVSAFTGGVTNAGTISMPSGAGIVVGGCPCGVSTFEGGVVNTGTITGLGPGISVVDVESFAGGIVNDGGTITPGAASGIVVTRVSSFAGGISNSGRITAVTAGIMVSEVSAFSGGITNSGSIFASGVGITVGTGCGCAGVSTFSGGIVNSGRIRAGTGIAVSQIETFTGGIVNQGLIAATAMGGISVSFVDSFSGGILNTDSSVIRASAFGISANDVSVFSGGISNAGRISAGFAGIAALNVTNFSGGITNTGLISVNGPGSTGIVVAGISIFDGGISNGGTITGGLTGIVIQGVDTFVGGIINTGTIEGVTGIQMSAVSLFSGGITNGGTITGTTGAGLEIGCGCSGISTFLGGIVNTGSISGMSGILIAGTSGVSIFNSGTITGTGGPAIQFAGSGNTLTLGPGSSIAGDVIATPGDIFQLGGTGSDTFDVSSIGAQYQNFAVFNKIDSSTWRLTGTGAQNWTISGGTLIGNTDSLQGSAITNNATLVFDQAMAGAYAGVISGSGAVVKDGSGTLTFTGAHLYSAGTVINAGILRLEGSGSLAAGGALTVNASGTFDLNGHDQTVGDFSGAGLVTLGTATLTAGTANSTTFAGVISGSGGLIKQGSGTLFLTGASTYDGPTNVAAGILTVNGSLTSNVFVGPGAMLMGSGTVGGLNLGSGGTLAPGNSIGTLNVAGNVSIGSGSVYQVEINAAGQSDKVEASGSATLTGGTVEVIALPGSYGGTTTYTILSAQLGVTGTFAGATSNLAFFTPTLSYDPNNVLLTWTRSGYFSSVAQTANQRSVATALDQGPLSNPLVQAVLFQTTGGALAAFDALSGEIHGSVQSVLMEDSLVMRQAILGRLRQGAAAGAGAMPLAYDGPVLAYAPGLPEVIKGPAAPRAGGPDLTFWSQGIGAFGRFESDGNAAEVKRKLGGFVSGVDARFGEFMRVGMAAGYTHAAVNADARASSAGVDTVHLGAYAGASFGGLSLRAGAAYAIHRIDTSRTISFPGFLDHTTARYDAGTAQVFGEIGYRLAFGRVVAEPYAGLAYVHLRTDSFAETGGAAALFGTGNITDIGYSTLGIRAATAVPLDHGMILMPRASVAWQHAFGDVTPAAALALQATGAGFNVAGVPAARDAALIEAGLTLDLNAQARLGLGYAAELGRGLQDHGVKGYVSWRF